MFKVGDIIRIKKDHLYIKKYQDGIVEEIFTMNKFGIGFPIDDRWLVDGENLELIFREEYINEI